MAPASYTLTVFLVLGLLFCSAHGIYLRRSYYDKSCPKLQSIVREEMTKAVKAEKRMGASLLRLHFHDCFVQGCDASVLLDDAPGIKSEKNAPPNANSLRGFEVIDTIKARLEKECPRKVSCADILAVAARDSVVLLGGPTYEVTFGRKDSKTASYDGANSDLPSPFADLTTLKQKYAAKGLSRGYLTALSGAHTIGQVRCSLCRERIYTEKNIDPSYAKTCQSSCPQFGGGDSTLLPMDYQTPNAFDNKFYINLRKKKGLLHSDQELYNNGTQDYLVRRYSVNQTAFFVDFAKGMLKMGSLVNTGETEVRLNCRKVN